MTVVKAPPLSASPVFGTISGTITIGGVPAPPGSVQVVFVKYNKLPTPNPVNVRPCAYGQPAPPSVNLIGVSVGIKGIYSQSLDTGFDWKVIFKPLATAPPSAVFRWYSASLPGGTTVGYSIDANADQATCISNLTSAGISNINVSTIGPSVQLTGTITTSSGVPTANAMIAITPTTDCFYSRPHGYTSRPNDKGQWEIAGIDTNQLNQYIQVVSPPGGCGGNAYLRFIKKVGDDFQLIPSSEISTCGQACRFDFLTSNIHKVALKLPVMAEVSGTVSGPTGPVGAGQVCVNAFRNTGTSISWHAFFAGSACTDSSGNYTLSLTFDTYRLQFVNQPGAPFKSLWYGATDAEGYSSATPLCLRDTGADCSTTRDIDITLEEGKSISGRVTDSLGAVANVTVHAMLFSSMGSFMGVGYARTDQNGGYAITGLNDGTYTLMFTHEDYGQQWLGGSRDSGQSFEVNSNVSGKNFFLVRGAKLSGRISTEDDSTARVCVSAFKVVETNMGWGNYSGGTCISAPGLWEIKGLQEGTYRIRFEAQSGNLRSTFLGGTDFTEATLVSVAGTDVSNLSVTIPVGKSISGRISDATEGKWVSTACVTAWLQKETPWGYGSYAGQSCTDTSGAFTIRGLAPGTYRIQINPPRESDLSPGWYSETGTPKGTMQAGDEVVITTSSSIDTSTITQSMTTGPSISAVLTNSDGDPVSGICVEAIKVSNETYGWGEWSGNSCSSVDGKIALRGLQSANYKLRVNVFNGDYQNGWIGAGSTTTNTSQAAVAPIVLGVDKVNLGSIKLTSGTQATGRILSGDKPITGACIGALKVTANNSWGEWSGSSCTQSDGKFAIRGLDPSGSYKFRVDIWQGDYKPGFIAANGTIQSNPDLVGGRNATSNILLGDIELPTAPSIRGTVFSGASARESNVCLNAHLASTLQWVASSCSQINGSYVLRGLEADSTYKISWWTQKPLLLNGWYKSRPLSEVTTQVSEPKDADDLLVPMTGLKDLDIRIGSGGSIIGSLTQGFCVAAWTSTSADRENASSTSCSNSDDLYELKGLTPNTNYYLQVFTIDGTPVTTQTPIATTAFQTGPSAVTITASTAPQE